MGLIIYDFLGKILSRIMCELATDIKGLHLINQRSDSCESKASTATKMS